MNLASLKRRFLEKISISENGCWIWTGAQDQHGYGKIWIHDNEKGHPLSIGAHRASWILFKKKIPKGKFVLHNCPSGDNPLCSNPNHLFLGTQGDNNRDTVKKGRCRAGHYNKIKTSCIRGHLLSGENLVKNSPTRQCLICKKTYYKRKRNEVKSISSNRRSPKHINKNGTAIQKGSSKRNYASKIH